MTRKITLPSGYTDAEALIEDTEAAIESWQDEADFIIGNGNFDTYVSTKPMLASDNLYVVIEGDGFRNEEWVRMYGYVDKDVGWWEDFDE